MKQEVKMKNELLDMLQGIMMKSHGEKMKPKAVEIEVIKAEPGESLDEVLGRAQKAEPMGDADGDGDHDMRDHEMEEDEEKFNCGGKVSMKDFFKKMRG